MAHRGALNQEWLVSPFLPVDGENGFFGRLNSIGSLSFTFGFLVLIEVNPYQEEPDSGKGQVHGESGLELSVGWNWGERILMSAFIRRESLPIHSGLTGVNPDAWTLDDGAGASALIWPALGFNLISWKVKSAQGPIDLIHRDPHLFDDGKSTRSGNPILFPFPNRINGGRYQFEGKEYQLERTGDSGRTAIHGFACRSPWKILEAGAENHEAWITGEFQIERDHPQALGHWPKNGSLRLTYRLVSRNGVSALRLEAQVDHQGAGVFPFGLGYHPYFSALPDWNTQVEVGAKSYWELDQCIPTGKVLPVDAARDLNTPRAMKGLKVDDVLTDLPAIAPKKDRQKDDPEMYLRGRMIFPQKGEMKIWCDSTYREVVVYTPPSGDCFCIEPYTCPTNAINRPDGGRDVGWIKLEPGASWKSLNEWTFES